MIRLTADELAYGYVRSQYVGKINITLWAKHGVYHVRAHDHAYSRRLWWDTYHNVEHANDRFETAVKVITAGQNEVDALRSKNNIWNQGFMPAGG